jgi:hypothetical protein
MPCRSSPNLIAWTVMQTGRVTPLVSGKPGCGKTKSIEAFARNMQATLHTLVGSLLEPTDFAIPQVGVEGFTRLSPPEWVHKLRQARQSVLFMDEVTQCSPAQQTPIMRIVAENRVGDDDLPDTLWKIAACNPPECAANGTELEPPLANRMMHLTWETDYEGWERAMSNGMNFTAPSFVPLPVDWEKCLGKNTGLVAAFHKHKPGLLEAYPKERARVSGPWPSMRSWTNASIAMAALDAIDAEPVLRYRALAGCVGEEAALEYQTWETKLDLPDPEVWLAHAEKVRAGTVPMDLDVPQRCDQIMAVLTGLVDRVKNHSLADDGKPTEGRWLAAVGCFAEVAKTWVEPAIAAAGTLYFCAPGDAGKSLVKASAEYPDFTAMVLDVHKNVTQATR